MAPSQLFAIEGIRESIVRTESDDVRVPEQREPILLLLNAGCKIAQRIEQPAADRHARPSVSRDLREREIDHAGECHGTGDQAQHLVIIVTIG